MIVKLEKEEDFVKTIKENAKVVVDFNATWCGPCRNMSRVIEDLEDEFKDVVFLKVDTDSFPAIAQNFGVMSIPDLIAFYNGNRIHFVENGEYKEDILGSRYYDDFHTILEDTFKDPK